MKKTKLISFLLSTIIFLGLLGACDGKTGPRGPQGEQGIQGEMGPAGKDGASFLTGKGSPAKDLGNVGDSYLDIEGEEWGFYIKGEDGWKLLGFLEAEPAPLVIDDLDGSYALSHVVSGSKTYNLGDEYLPGLTLSAEMIQVELHGGVGHLTVNFTSVESTNITCTIEYDKLIMICENALNITGQPTSVYELSVVKDGGIYVVLEAYGDYYYVKKMN